MATIIQLANFQRNERSDADAKKLEAAAEAFGAMYDNLEGDVDALILAIEDMDNPSKSELEALPQYKRLIRNGTRELDRYTVYLETVIGAAGLAAVSMGLQHSSQLVSFASNTEYSGVSSRVVTPLLEYLKRDGPLYERLKLITNSTIDGVIDAIINGVLSGFNPRKIAEMIQDAFGGGLTDALRNVRTVQIKAYQDAARANYVASDGLVSGWIWYANLDGDPCMSCIAMHGTEHPLDESLDDHYNGECAALPLIPEFGSPVEQSGQEWFDSLPEERQRDLMGDSKYEAYKADMFAFDALSNQQDHDIYGTMRTETSLKDLVPNE